MKAVPSYTQFKISRLTVQSQPASSVFQLLSRWQDKGKHRIRLEAHPTDAVNVQSSSHFKRSKSSSILEPNRSGCDQGTWTHVTPKWFQYIPIWKRFHDIFIHAEQSWIKPFFFFKYVCRKKLALQHGGWWKSCLSAFQVIPDSYRMLSDPEVGNEWL